MKELISVIIPTYNRAAVLIPAIQSVLNQTYPNIEVIIIDDGSTDETEQLLSPYIKNHSIHYYKFTNNGVAAARNKGVSLSSGKWIAFLDSDDEWLENKLEEQIIFLHGSPHIHIVYTDEVWIKNGLFTNKKKNQQKKGGWIFSECLEQCFIAPSSVLLSRKLFDEMKGFDESFIVCEDYDLWLKISLEYEIGFINKALIKKYGGHKDQLSTRFFAMDTWRIKSMQKILDEKNLSAHERLDIIKNLRFKSAILIKGFLKHGNKKAAEDLKQFIETL